MTRGTGSLVSIVCVVLSSCSTTPRTAPDDAELDATMPNTQDSSATDSGDEPNPIPPQIDAERAPPDVGRDVPSSSEPRIAVDWVRIEGGRFLMDPDPWDPDWYRDPPLEVTVPTFDISRTEVTLREYKLCVADGGCGIPTLPYMVPPRSSCAWDRPADETDIVVDCVTWDNAQEFVSWVGGGVRLPSESEFEYAARGQGQERIFPWGNEAATCDRVIMQLPDPGRAGCGRDDAWPPCSRPLGNSPQGVCDLVGNLLEWTEDYWHGESLALVPTNGSPCVVPSEMGSRVLKSSPWWGADLQAVHTARQREGSNPVHRGAGVGMRLARPVAPESWRRPSE